MPTHLEESMTTIVGLVGLAGSGKSFAANRMKEFGFTVIDMDQINHELLTHDDVIARIKKKFPTVVQDGIVNRKLLGDIVFYDESKLKLLNNIMFPLFLKEIEAQTKEEGKYVLDMAVLFDAGADEYCEYIIYVDTEEDIRFDRLKARGLSDDKISALLKTQMHLDDYINQTDAMIFNDGDESVVDQAIKAILDLWELA